MLVLVVALAGTPAFGPVLRGAGDEGVAAVSAELREAAGPAARARLEGRSGAEMAGAVTVTAEGPEVHVSIRVSGAAPGNHAIFLHEHGDCSAVDASSAGGWFGGSGALSPGVAGDPGGPPPGYLGFVTVGPDGRGAKDVVLRAYTLDAGPAGLLDRAVVVYERAPEFTRGESPGARQACGVLRAP